MTKLCFSFPFVCAIQRFYLLCSNIGHLAVPGLRIHNCFIRCVLAIHFQNTKHIFQLKILVTINRDCGSVDFKICNMRNNKVIFAIFINNDITLLQVQELCTCVFELVYLVFTVVQNNNIFPCTVFRFILLKKYNALLHNTKVRGSVIIQIDRPC